MKKIIAPFSIVLFSIFILVSCGPSQKAELEMTAKIDSLNQEENFLFGISLKDYDVSFDTVQRGWTWNNLFVDINIDQYTINQTAKRLRDSTIDLKYIVTGETFAVFTPKNNDINSTYLVYEPNPFSYITINFNPDTIRIERKKRPIETKERMISGIIQQNSSLSAELSKNFQSYQMSSQVAQAIEGIYAWNIDFFQLQAGDRFVAVYTEKSIDGVPYKVEKINYIWFEHAGKGMYAFHYKNAADTISGYYNEEAKEMKRPFLKAPVEFSRISSPFTLRRYHPVQHVWKAHLGTDYAAPTGTPIHATASGTIERARYSRYNGNYVKIRHNSVYETQYLHMSKIKDGIHSGVYVEQGEVIGFVGQTGLATGPHVCYRFWKNGRQVDPRKQEFPDSEPMKESAKPAYLKYIAPLKKKLDKAIQDLQKKERQHIVV